MSLMEIWAHRGRVVRGEIGNSEKNFISCYDIGITGVETDVCLTRDNKMIVYHPGTFTPDLVNMNLSEIRQSHPDILLLDDLLSLLERCPGLKCSLDMKQNSIVLALMAARAIVIRKMEDRVYLSAFQKSIPSLAIESDGNMLAAAKKNYPNIKTHIMVLFPFNLPELADEYKPDVISFGWLQEPLPMRLLSKTIFKSIARFTDLKRQVADVRNRKIKVWGGVVNGREDMIYFESLGVDGIVTDRPIIGIYLFYDQKLAG